MQRIDQRASKAGERVLNFRRNDRMNFPEDQSISLQTAERLREHLLRDPADLPEQRTVALRSVGQNVNNQRRPFIRDPIQDDARRTLGF